MNYEAVVTLASLTLASCSRAPGASGHPIRTAYIATCLSKLMGLDMVEQERIRLTTPVHDIGKLAVPDRVLLKPGRLDHSERLVMERHPSIGADLLEGSADELLQFAAQIARYHHERYDGTGYPCGLAACNIPLAARIVAVADAFDAMTEARCYHPGMTDEVALSVITSSSGTHFDPDVAEAFADAIPLVLRARETANELVSLRNNAVMVAKFYGCESPGIASFCGHAPALTTTA